MKIGLSQWFIFIGLLTLLTSSYSFAIFDIELLGGQRAGKMKVVDISNNTESLKSIESNETSLGLHLSFPFVPLAFGVVAQDDNYDLNKATKDQFDRLYNVSFASSVDPTGERAYFDFAKSVGSLKGRQYGPELKVWLPLGNFKPHLRLAYLMGAHTLKQNSSAKSKPTTSPVSSIDYTVDQSFKSTSTEIGVGFTYSFLSVFAFIAEYNTGSLSLERTDADISYAFSQAGQTTASTHMTKNDFARKKDTMTTSAIRLGLSFGF